MAEYYYSIDRKELEEYKPSPEDKKIFEKCYVCHKCFLYDLFISHSFRDKDIIENLVFYLWKKYRVRCFVDWKVLPRNPYVVADILKDIMHCCKAMLILRTENSDASYWVPWEAGCFETMKDTKKISGAKYVALLSITNKSEDVTAQKILNKTFHHMEFLKRYVQTNMTPNTLHHFFLSVGIIK
ncbi:MAG: hypothetical protein IJ545_02215 [Alphaproteobacteria bacterium]|nr:hypothetical protein [Alphaproteobacteria bacterium]